MKKIFVLGGTGLVGSKFVELNSEYFDIKAPDSSQLDILNKDALEEAIQDFDPEAVINFVAFTQVEEAEDQKGDEQGLCFKLNVLGPRYLADICKKTSKHLVHISTEYVFNGTKEDVPYNEDDKPSPINWYGQTKYLGEKEVLEYGENSVIVRISMPYTDHYELKKDIARFFLEQLKSGKAIKAIEDQKITPTLVLDIANALKIIIDNKALGIYHISATDSVSPLEFAKTIAETFNLDYSLIEGIKLDKYNEQKKAKLLKYSWLNPAKFDKEFGSESLHTVEEDLIILKNLLTQG